MILSRVQIPINQKDDDDEGRVVANKVIGQEAKYTIEKEIGKGSFAIVYMGHLTTNKNQNVAIKAVSRSKLKNKKLLENLEIEIAILKKIKHNHIVSLIDCERNSDYFYLIMEYCSLGDLTFLIKRRKELTNYHPLLQKIFESYPSPNEYGLHHAFILNYLQQLASALKFLRSKNLIHRDIKPQNLLLCTPLIGYTDADTFHKLGYVGIYNLPILKIADFGFARFLPNSSMAETLCGSPLYMAPEILNYQKYNAKADLWSVGTVLFEMYCGRPPFKASNHLELYKKIKRSNDVIQFPELIANGDDKDQEDLEIRALISKLLTFDPTNRITFDEFFNHKLVTKDLSYYEINNDNSTSDLETKSKNIVESNMFISEYLNKPKNVTSTQGKISLQNDKNTIRKEISNLEKEYVVVEKKSVEVNEFADELANQINNQQQKQQNENTNVVASRPKSRRSSSSSSTATNRAPSLVDRRLSFSSLNPSNALSRALGLASTRFFGNAHQSQHLNTQLNVNNNSNTSIFDSQTFNDLTENIILRINNPEFRVESNKDSIIIPTIESLAAKAFVISSFADTKFQQIIPLNKFNEIIENSINEQIDINDMVLFKEAVILHLKALEFLSSSMEVTSKWWFTNKFNVNYNISLRLNLLIQWVRSKFNDCLNKVEFLKKHYAVAHENESYHYSEETEIFLEKLLYDRALEIAKMAANLELNHSDLNNCEISYATALWMLEATLDSGDNDGNESVLDQNDKMIILKYIDSIANRLKVLRTKMNNGGNNVNNSGTGYNEDTALIDYY
ncbi:hypothetical protein KAFR_0C03010 [Kazachstania africana CBS 2517]|uniref:Serine/threonine-protein kinase ATG1 n=1 Tax=Kazachstania africana (strain ATCC 22294 / BCRC 22015 / CBS 2517 / CECT 1963 / NBRC 1671 / NRRL Y-8276) TaxID=1071382 RepID=H2ASE4_KAZAF|nr:hypothetical protein KAFR_0C03010 [Kazachstania africana CBS 2517]CCF57294.1 hypothetical protein KAFR_0C03010 [Kazachstania africana CBS 2517]